MSSAIGRYSKIVVREHSCLVPSVNKSRSLFSAGFTADCAAKNGLPPCGCAQPSNSVTLDTFDAL